MTREDALELVRRLQTAANRHDTGAIMACYADDAVAVSPQFSVLEGRAAIARAWDRLFSMLPDCAIDVADVLVDGDRIAIIGTVTATDRVGWFGLPATGSVIAYRINILCTILDGVIAREERIYDSAGVVERLQKALVDKELRTAAAVQRALLSRTEYVGRSCEAAGDSLPCRAIGGDFFELVELPGDRLGIALGDVAGKGAPAALLAAMLQGLLAAEVHAGGGPAQTLARINERLTARRLDARFATMVYGVLSPTGELVYSNAGHNPPALVGGGRTRRLTAGGPILGVFPDASFAEATVRLDERDTLVMFTDGATDARNRDDAEFGEDRLVSCAAEHAALPPRVLVARLLAAVRGFCDGADQGDDITLIVTRFLGSAPGQGA
jgi:serine phosphatase RsbU (regulator of sigma subunit)